MGVQDPSRHRRLTWLVGTSLTSALTVAAYVLQGVLGRSLPDWAYWTLLGGGAIFTALSVLIPGLAVHRRERERRNADEIAVDAGRRAQTTIFGYLTPALDAVARIASDASASSRELRQRQIVQSILDIAISTKPDTRACFFDYDPGPPRTLTCDGVWAARDTRRRPPRPKFEQHDGGAGDQLFSMFDNQDHPIIFVEDCENEHTPGWSPEKDYKTFISATVAAGKTIFGFLGVDAPEPEILTKDDKDVIRVLAQVLSVALAIRR